MLAGKLNQLNRKFIMNRFKIFFTVLLCTITLVAYTQKTKTDANIVGHVVNEQGEHIPFATVSLVGTTIGTATDKTGITNWSTSLKEILLLRPNSWDINPEPKM